MTQLSNQKCSELLRCEHPRAQVWKSSRWEEVDLSPLQTLIPRQLTSISLNNKHQLPAAVDLRWVPSCVRELNIKGFTVRPNHPRALEHLRLHSLDCRNGETPPTETWRLLQCLPSLKVKRSTHACRSTWAGIAPCTDTSGGDYLQRA